LSESLMATAILTDDFPAGGGPDDPTRMKVEDKAHTPEIWPISKRLSDFVEY